MTREEELELSYVSLNYYALLVLLVILYYIFPLKHRWCVLLAGSGCFYYLAMENWAELAVFLASIGTSYLFGILIQRLRERKSKPSAKGLVLASGIILSVFPLLGSKLTDFILGCVLYRERISWIIPLGLSFYSLQIAAYLIDIARGHIDCQKNLLKYALFISFFPQIIQGPIPRYQQLSEQLVEGHRYDSLRFMKGIQLILWGSFLKFMIANKASIIVDTIFNNDAAYRGLYVLIGGILYSFQLYADFLSCVTLSQGAAQLFGIQLIDNFKRPYFAVSVQDFWRRWHISLSSWLRDYIYIPLGGSRHGEIDKYVNLALTFVVSGIWHGATWKYLFWGLLHAGYQVAGNLTKGVQKKIYSFFHIPWESTLCSLIRRFITFYFVMLGWIVFRANSLKSGIGMIWSMFTFRNPWILFDDSLFRLGLDQKEWAALVLSLLVLFLVSALQEKGINIRNWFNQQRLIVRWSIYLVVICSIWVFGTYGYGFNAGDFIYGGF